MSVGRICVRSVVVAAPDESVAEAAKRMAEHGVGTLVVQRGSGMVVGMVTDRDVAVRCVAAGLSPEGTQLHEIMSSPALIVTESSPIEDALAAMARAGTRRLVVTGASGKLVGLVALDDVLELLVEEVASIGRLLKGGASPRG